MQRVNPSKPESGLVDYKGELRMTPAGAAKAIKQLRKSATLDDDQLGLLSELEAYLARKFPPSQQASLFS
jgi:hypothetical protein